MNEVKWDHALRSVATGFGVASKDGSLRYPELAETKST